MPPLDGATTWLGSAPLSPRELRGRVVLVDFWTWTCINWLRTAAHVRAWARAYRDDGLVVVGVHAPEFSFEHEVDGVRRAIAERGIDHPVAVDNDHRIWTAFDNHYWPALYFVDRDGVVRAHHFGEGRYAESERLLQRLLGVERELVDVHGTGVEVQADWANLRTPETYLGYGRGERFASPSGAALDEPRDYELPARLGPGQWALRGEWTIGPEHVALDGPEGSVAWGFHARDAHIVLAPAGPGEVPFRVLLDGAAPGAAHGVDVDEDGHGVLREGRMYQLVRQPGAVRDRVVEVHLEARGVRAYVLTFG